MDNKDIHYHEANSNNIFQQYIDKKIGKPVSYTPEELAQKVLDYLDFMKDRYWIKYEVIKSGDHAGTLIEVPAKTPMTIESFCTFAGISRTTTWNNYVLKNTNSEYASAYYDICQALRDIINSQFIEGGLLGAYNSNIVSRLLGLAEHTEISGSEGGPIKIEQITGMEVK